jgi:acyl carrier protein
MGGSEGSPMTSEQVIERLNRILLEEFELEPYVVVPEARLREDLDLDSLDAVDLIVAVEREFGVRLDDKLVMEMRTVSDMHGQVHRVLAERGSLA